MNKKIRNFTIIAHVDHGKSTLADRILMKCQAVSEREFHNQMLDSMDLEKERGITIKAQTARLIYNYKNTDYTLNLIDTPGHSDFSYEVSRSLRACEISLLLIDATKGVEAQTVSNLYKAMEANHFIIPVLNKIDLPTARIDSCMEEIDKLGLDIALIHQISAKSGLGIDNLLGSLIDLGPYPQGETGVLRALIVDSWYDKYFGVVTIVRIIDGEVRANIQLKACSNGKIFNVLQVGYFLPKLTKCEKLFTGEIGYIITQVKNPSELQIGDTLTNEHAIVEPLEGFKKSVPLVFCTFYPVNPEDATEIHEALEKYQLNDSAFTFSLENSDIYGMTFRCGFLGLLHLEIVKERLEREYGADVIPTIPGVTYRLTLRNENVLHIYNANDWPSKESILKAEEPEVNCTIFTSSEFIGKVSGLCIKRRAENLDISINDEKVIITCKIPLAEIIVDFSDHLQSLTSGFASFEYEIAGYRTSNLSRLIILVNDEPIKEFGIIVHESKARAIGKSFVEKLKDIIPRGQVKIKIQVAVDTPKNIIARADVDPYRKDVIAGCYGGDVSRKNKLLNKQKKGKSKMQTLSGSTVMGRIPNNAVKELLKMDIN